MLIVIIYACKNNNDDLISVNHDLTVSSPSENDIWYFDSTYTIEWANNFDENVLIELFKYDSLKLVISESASGDSSFNRTIPETVEPDTSYSIRIKSLFDTDFGESVLFEIKKHKFGTSDNKSRLRFESGTFDSNKPTIVFFG
ncbi:hypothetical protein ES703_108833 [subsurface metagenome]